MVKIRKGASGGECLVTQLSLLESVCTLTAEPYESRKMRRTQVRGYIVSTIYAHDRGAFETAILGENRTAPVEFYNTGEEASAGHVKWVEKVKSPKFKGNVTMIGFGVIDPEEVVICPFTKEALERMSAHSPVDEVVK